MLLHIFILNTLAILIFPLKLVNSFHNTVLYINHLFLKCFNSINQATHSSAYLILKVFLINILLLIRLWKMHKSRWFFLLLLVKKVHGFPTLTSFFRFFFFFVRRLVVSDSIHSFCKSILFA